MTIKRIKVKKNQKHLMTDLQKKVYLAIKYYSTPEEQADAAIRAVSAWYWERGHFHRFYELDEQLPNKFTV